MQYPIVDDGMNYELWRKGPYQAKSASSRTDNWPLWFVCGPDGINCLRWLSKAGAVFASREEAERIAALANRKYA